MRTQSHKLPGSGQAQQSHLGLRASARDTQTAASVLTSAPAHRPSTVSTLRTHPSSRPHSHRSGQSTALRPCHNRPSCHASCPVAQPPMLACAAYPQSYAHLSELPRPHKKRDLSAEDLTVVDAGVEPCQLRLRFPAKPASRPQPPSPVRQMRRLVLPAARQRVASPSLHRPCAYSSCCKPSPAARSPGPAPPASTATRAPHPTWQSAIQR
jgi:hypothetical protein